MSEQRQKTSNRRTVAIIAPIAILLLIVAGIVISGLHSNGNTASPLDPGLERSGAGTGTALQQVPGKLPVVDSSLNSFKAWVYDMQAALAKLSPKSLPSGQFVQLQLTDPSTMPPQSLSLPMSGHQVIPIDNALLTKVVQTGKPVCTTLADGARNLRTCVRPLAVPLLLQPAQVNGLIEVFAVAS